MTVVEGGGRVTVWMGLGNPSAALFVAPGQKDTICVCGFHPPGFGIAAPAMPALRRCHRIGPNRHF